MAKMYLPRANDTCRFGCYSERGLMSWFMFVWLPQANHLQQFLQKLMFLKGNPFQRIGEQPKTTLYSELDLGKRYGFGCPDAAIFIEDKLPRMLFIEVKLNGRYPKSFTKGKGYNSTIKGQLELKWRLTQALKKLSDKEFNEGQDVAEKDGRKLKISNGVKGFLENLRKCGDRIYFCAITNEKNDINPLPQFESCQQPEFPPLSWDKVQERFCWLPVSYLTKKTGEAENG